MRWRAKWSHVAIALGLIAALAFAAPGFSLDKGTNKAIKKAVKKEVAKQIGNATGPPGANGLNGANGTARAYARVVTPTCTPGCSFDDSKGVTSVTRTGGGSYCVTAPGLSSADTPAAVTVDWAITADPEGDASAMLAQDGGCPDGGFLVITERQPVTPVRNAADTGAINVAGNAQPANDVAFTIVIP